MNAKLQPADTVDLNGVPKINFPSRRYELRRLLGHGGMGKVWLAFDHHFGMEVALKLPRRRQSDDLINRLRQEARYLAKLSHPNICRIFDVGQVDGDWYISMAYIDGTPLLYDRQRSITESVDIVRTTARAVEEAHQLGIIHRDLKPANILVNARRQPIVMDFGLASSLVMDDLPSDADSVGGTLQYMSPEQYHGGQLGPQSDVYSLGVILFELLTDRPPIPLGELRARLVDPTHRCDPPSSKNDQIDAVLDEITLRALEKCPGDRFKRMNDFADALERYLITRSVPPAPRVLPELIKFGFAGQNQNAPANNRQQDRLFVDAGNRLGTGAIDHHQLETDDKCSALLLLENPEFVDDAVKPWRLPHEPFLIVTHNYPDLDGVVSAYLAMRRLLRTSTPAAVDQLVNYVQCVDRGELGMTPERPFSLYAAYMQLAHSMGQRKWNSWEDCWREALSHGVRLTAYVAEQAATNSLAIGEIDAFAAPGLFREADRSEVCSDSERYEQKLAEPRCHAQTVQLRLTAKDGLLCPVPFLYARHVQDPDDPERCLFFKDWARSDRQRCPQTNGFVGLCIYSKLPARDADASRRGRAIISVRPGHAVHLKGVGRKLEIAEQEKRHKVYGEDSRDKELGTDELLDQRSGFSGPDPWYDGRAHGYTIVDSPHQGTVLSAEEIEQCLTEFGDAI